MTGSIAPPGSALFEADESRDEFDLDPLACPGVFYPTLAADGVLSRIRTPGGMLTARQCRLVAAIAERYAGGRAALTNRANIQLRALADRLPDVVLHEMQREGLASDEPAIDHLRNVMISPLAGLGSDAAFDSRTLVAAIVQHLRSHAHLAALPAKFSVGIDGGERVSIAGFPNDILLRAVAAAELRVLLRAGSEEGDRIDLGLAVPEGDALSVIAAVADWYVAALPTDGGKPRLRELLTGDGIEALLSAVISRVPTVVAACPIASIAHDPVGHAPVGVQAQRQDGLRAIGLAPRLDGWSSAHLRAVADVAERFGSGTLRLSPWRTVVVPDVPVTSVAAALDAIEAAGLSAREPSLADGIVACVGMAGCTSGGTDTMHDAAILAAQLVGAGAPTDVHFSGCAKRCSQRRDSELTLVGDLARPGTYDVFVAGRLQVTALAAADAIEYAARYCTGDASAATV